MEAKLFFVSLWCGVYSLLLRGAYRREPLLNKMFVPIIFNGLFWGTGAFLAGMLFASYTEKIDQLPSYALVYFAGGFLLGSIRGYFRGRDHDKRDVLLKDNLEWSDTGFSAILLASLVMFFVVQAFKIPSGSMRMTFIEGDHLFVNKFIYGIPVPFTDKKVMPFQPIKQKDIVIFRFPSDDKTSPHYGKDFIKRVIATEGQTVKVVNKIVYVDGVALDEPYKNKLQVDPDIYPPVEGMTQAEFQKKWEEREFAKILGNDIRDNFGPVVVPKGDIFVMGDNRDRSFDARFWGPLPITAIKGKAWLLYWPFTRFKVVH